LAQAGETQDFDFREGCMKVRLFLDEDIHLALAGALRKRGYDAIHAAELRRFGMADKEQLEFATREGRCLLTFNVGDFVQLHNEWIESGREHAGIIVSKQMTIGNALRGLLVLLQEQAAASVQGQLRFL
jgi:hypothetical protein